MMSQRQVNDGKRIFHVDLKPYDQGILGFDVTRFDDEVIKSGNQSMRAAVLQTFGSEGVRLIEELLGMVRA